MTQKQQVKIHLQKKGKITSVTAFRNYGITRLSSIILRLRREGMSIESVPKTGENRYGNKVNYASYEI